MKASQIQPENESQSFLFKSPFGFGKTLAAASFALGGPIHLAYWDKKSPIELLTYFKRFGTIGEQILDNIDYDIYGSDNANEYLNKLIKCMDDCRYFAMVNDSLTFMTASAVNWSLNFGKRKGERNIKNILPDFDEWKTETSLVTQCLDISKSLPCHIIWTAHPIPGIKIEGSGASIKVNKVNSLVTYGSKIAGIVPGAFTEIYHFSQQNSWDSSTGKSSKKYIASLEAVGDEFAKSPLLGHFVKEIDFTDKLFFQVWKELLLKSQGVEIKQNATEQPQLKSPWRT